MISLRVGPVGRRLAPLYCAAFLQSFIFWYVIEKLFMRGIGFNDATIGLMAGVYSAAMLITETPSGILADRWSRKGVLIIGSVALALSSYVCGSAKGVVVFMVGSALWGIFFAMYSGTYDSIIYDTLQEEVGHSNDYEQYYGRVRIVESLALVITSLAGAYIGDAISLQTAFYWTIPFSVISIIPLVLFREPKLHKAEIETPLSQHVLGTFKAVLQRGWLLQVLLVISAVTLSIEIITEFTQLWYIAIGMPIALYGVANAFLLGAPGLAGWLSKMMIRPAAITGLLLAGTITSLGLVFGRHSWTIIVLQTIFCASLTVLEIILNKRLHDQLPSKVRAGAVSAVNTLSRIVFIPISIFFGYISNRHSIFAAAWIMVAVFAVVVLGTPKVLRGSPQSAQT